MSAIAKLAAMLHPLERKLVPHLRDGISAAALCARAKLSETEVLRALMWLEHKQCITTQVNEETLITLDANGVTYAERGLPEHRLLAALVKHEREIPAQQARMGAGLSAQEIGVSIGLLKAKRYAIVKGAGAIEASAEGRNQEIDKPWPEELLLHKLMSGLALEQLDPQEQSILAALRQRRQIVKQEVVKAKTITLTELGKQLIAHGVPQGEVLDRLTPEMLRSGEWRGKAYRHYDVETHVPAISGGKRHFVNQAIQYIRQIWLELGFQEMAGSMVQTAFWDLDVLFVPQDHPARQMQDTFYMRDAKQEDKILRGKIPAALAKKIKAVHEHGGGMGSMGWGGSWSADEAAKVLLRTHTTVLSAQVLANLKFADLPAKFFAIAPVFRNEALDWKHLFEFHQVDGIVVDPDANFSHLKGYLRTFYAKMGYRDVRLRPGYFPYVEPGLEIEVFHPVKREWVELGGAGIFRPEVVKPLLGFDCPVLAWGLGLGRIISEYWNITDIRDLNENDLQQLREIKAWSV